MSDGVVVQHLLRERVAEEVRALLARKMMTGADLALAIGRSPMYVSRRIRGEVAFDLDDMQRIAEALGVGVGDLLPKGFRAGGDSLNASSTTRQTVTDESAPPMPHHPASRPFGPGRRDSTRPGSAVPPNRRRPVTVRPMPS